MAMKTKDDHIIINDTLVEWTRDTSNRRWMLYVSPVRDYIGVSAARLIFSDRGLLTVEYGGWPSEGVEFIPKGEYD